MSAATSHHTSLPDMLTENWGLISLTAKIVAFGVTLALSVAILLIGMHRALAAPVLKESAIVNGDMLKLGDIFDGLPANAEYVIGPAPQPGKDMVLNARTLYRLAVALELPW